MQLGMCRRGAGLANIIVTVGIAALLLGVIAPLIAAAAQEKDKRTLCAANLRNIAQHAFIYANAERFGQRFPRLYYNPKLANEPQVYTGADSKDSFVKDQAPPNGPKACDVTGALYLLIKKADTAPDAFICPEDKAAALKGDVQQHSNFAGRANLSYSYNNPYPASEAIMSGWRFDVTLGPDHPLASDMNPGDTKEAGPTKVSTKSDAKAMALANSRNHGGTGQNVAYCDGHVEWQTTPFCGVQRSGKTYRDNIFANHPKEVDADGKGGATNAPAQDAADAVMLPTYLDGPQPK